MISTELHYPEGPMPYVIRDSAGRIVQVIEETVSGADENLPVDSAELREYYEGRELGPNTLRMQLVQSDQGMARLVEDLIDILIAKHVIQFTDLPPAAGEKYLQRQGKREKLGAIKNLIEDDKALF
jgi:hypothetical protein